MSHIFIKFWYYIKSEGNKIFIIVIIHHCKQHYAPALIDISPSSAASVGGHSVRTPCTHTRAGGDGGARDRKKQIINLQSFSCTICLDKQPLTGAGKIRCTTWPSVCVGLDCTGVQRRESECLCVCLCVYQSPLHAPIYTHIYWSSPEYLISTISNE